MKVTLSSGEASIKIFFSSKLVDFFSRGRKQQVVKRTTTAILADAVGAKLVEETVSVSHKDKFTKLGGRKEVTKLVLSSMKNQGFSYEDRFVIARKILPEFHN